MFNMGDIITLADNNKYTVVDKFDDSDNTYVYLVDINNVSNIIYGKVEDDEIVTLTDPDELEKVVLRVYSDIHIN